MIVVMMAALLQTFDATIVNVALPTVKGNIAAAIDDVTWIITGYIISNVITIPLVGYMLQRVGRYFAARIIGFTVASFLCGTASTLWILVAYRILGEDFERQVLPGRESLSAALLFLKAFFIVRPCVLTKVAEPLRPRVRMSARPGTVPCVNSLM